MGSLQDYNYIIKGLSIIYIGILPFVAYLLTIIKKLQGIIYDAVEVLPIAEYVGIKLDGIEIVVYLPEIVI